MPTLSPLFNTISRLNSPMRRGTSSSLDREMMGYAEQAKQEDERKQKRFQPLQMVLDILQRGQYLTANIADEIEESFRTGRPLGESTAEVIRAAFQGLTGKRKGDWETLLFGGTIGGESDQAGERAGWIPQDVQEKLEKPLIHWGKEGATGLAEGILRPSKAMGLIANVFLDPTTYVSFGATKFAGKAAEKYADDVVKLTLATMGPDDFAKLGLKFSEKTGKNMSKVIEAIQKSGGDVARRFISKTYDDAYKYALRNTPEKLMQKVAPQQTELLTKGNWTDIKGMEDLIAGMAPQAYKGAGQRAMNFFGKEVGVGERYPGVLRAWDQMGEKFEKTKVGGKLGDAWWSIMNKGPVGSIRRALGIRNPYQQMLHLDQRKREMIVGARAENEALKLKQVFGKFDDDIVEKHKMLRMEANDTSIPVSELARRYTNPNLMGPSKKGMHGLEIGDVEKVIDLDKQVDEIVKKWYADEEAKTIAAGLPWDVTERVEYFPQQVGRGVIETSKSRGAAGTGPKAFKQSKKMGVGDHVDNNAYMFEWLMGDQLKAAYKGSGKEGQIAFHDWVKDWVTQKNLSETTLDLQEALTLRGIDHSKYMGRMEMITDLKQFGIPLTDAVKAMPDLESKIMQFGGDLSTVGLYKSTAPGLENYLFDKDVADVIDQAAKIVSTDQTMNEFASLFANGTAWWKGWVTMNPGFHARNSISNNITGFLKFGPRWFTDKDKIMESIAITAYALHPDKYADLLKNELKVTDGWIANVLNRQMKGGDFTNKELGDYVRSSGLVSKHTQVAEEIGGKAGTTLNPLSSKFKGFDISRSFGDVIENQSKVLSFLHDYDDIAKQMGATGGDLAGRLASRKQALEYADQEAKKWFIDYGDLTEFERKVMKKIIPFYTWTRKNLANQIAGLTLYPNMYSLIPKIRGAMTQDDDFDYSLLPDYMENMGYYPVGQTAAGGTILRWANIPLEDINKIPVTFGEGGGFSLQEVMNDVASNAHPLIKSAIELMTGKDIFRQRDIKATEKAPGVLQYLSKSPKIVEFLDGMLRLAGVKNGMQINPVKGGLEMDGRLVKMLENNVPVLRVLDNMLNNPEAIAEAVFPDLESAIEQISGKKDTQSALNEIFNIISRTAGWKFREIQMDEEEQRKQVALLKRAEELRAEQRKQLPGYQVRSAKALKARQKRAARYF